MSIKTLGVDLGKFSCHVIGQNQHGKVVEKRKILLSKFAEYLANLPSFAVFFESCGGAHHWCRRCITLTGLLANTDQFYWKTLTRLLVVLRSLDRKKDTIKWVSLDFIMLLAFT